MRRRTGSRMVRGGVTRGAKTYVDRLRATPLPEDRAERVVEEAYRSWVVAAAKDQRSPANKRQLHQAFSRYERVMLDHLVRTHGMDLKPNMVRGIGRIGWLLDGEPVYGRIGDLHDQHDGEAS